MITSKYGASPLGWFVDNMSLNGSCLPWIFTGSYEIYLRFEVYFMVGNHS